MKWFIMNQNSYRLGTRQNKGQIETLSMCSKCPDEVAGFVSSPYSSYRELATQPCHNQTTAKQWHVSAEKNGEDVHK